MSRRDWARMISFYRDAVSEYCASDVDAISLAHWMDDDDYEGDQMISLSMFDATVGHLLKSIPSECIKVNSRVTKITQTPGDNTCGVLIETEQKKTYSSRYTIVTIPLGVLKAERVEFSPPMGDNKLRAIKELGFGVFNKLFLQFSSPFWEVKKNVTEVSGELSGDESEVYPGEYVGVICGGVDEAPLVKRMRQGEGRERLEFNGWTSPPIEVDAGSQRPVMRRDLHFYNLNRRSKVPVLVAFFYGNDAKWIEGLDEGIVIDAVCGELESAFNVQINRKGVFCRVSDTGVPVRLSDDGVRVVEQDEPPATALESTLLTHWGSESDVRGSWTFMAVGSSGEMMDHLAEPFNDTVLFAGEATCRSHFGTISGAFESGEREAQRVMEIEGRVQ
eukprot:GHVN01017680.1.p1 GENE.GHVN01017680.1~~GHVN01017680.1.p1  ORF type:complete len:390 (-),score=99.28 GHVN01017680.1:130-1299(-)